MHRCQPIDPPFNVMIVAPFSVLFFPPTSNKILFRKTNFLIKTAETSTRLDQKLDDSFINKTMNRNLLFLFFFLASISVINATSFQACPPIPENPVAVATLTVTVVPDSIVSNQSATFTISGTALEDIPADAILLVGYDNPDRSPIGVPSIVPFCGSSDPCPVKNGDTFNRKLTAQAPTLPSAYLLVVAIRTDQPAIYGCAVAAVGAPPAASLEQIL